MAQYGSSELKKAFGELDAGGGSEPVLRPEQLERIKAIAAESDPEVKGQKTMALMDELTREADGVSARFREVLGGFGLEPGQTSAFLGGEKLSASARAEAEQARLALQQQIESEAEQAARDVSGKPKRSTAGATRAGRLRI